jgi:hypothetical protein
LTTAAIEMPINGCTAPVQAILDPVTALIEAILDPVTAPIGMLGGIGPSVSGAYE